MKLPFKNTYTRWTFEGEGEDPSRGDIQEAIRRHSFLGLEEHSDGPEFGWVCADDPLSTEFTYDQLFRGNTLVVNYRVDEWRYPASVVKARVRAREEERLREEGAVRLSRFQKAEIKEMVLRELRENMTPAMTTVLVVVEYDEEAVWASTTSARRLEGIEDLLFRSLRLRLTPTNLLSRLLRAGPVDHDRLRSLQPTRFA